MRIAACLLLVLSTVLIHAEEEDHVLVEGEELVELVKRVKRDGEEVEVEERAYVDMPLDEGATDPAVFEQSPVVLAAKKMSTLLQRQEVVSTCRYLLFKTWKNFYDARESCNSFEWPFTNTGIGMATVQSEDQNSDIRQLLQLAYGLKKVGGTYNRANWVWVGLEKHTDNNRKLKNWEKGNWNPEHWSWTDGSVPEFSKWRSKMPDQQWKRKYGTYQNWVQINKRGWWDDTHAAIEAPYACNYCGKYIVVAEPVSWTKAQELCESYGLTMAIVNSPEDNIELGWAANITFGAETHEQRWNYTNWIWLGTQEVLDDQGVGTGVWQHHDNSTLNWDPTWDKKHQPDNWVNKNGEQSVVAFSRINRKWDDSFPWKHRPFACMCPSRSCTYA